MHNFAMSMGAASFFKRRNFSPKMPRPSAADTPLDRLKIRYRMALSGAVVAKAHYLALTGEPFATPATIDRARWKWERIEARRFALSAQLSHLQDEALTPPATRP